MIRDIVVRERVSFARATIRHHYIDKSTATAMSDAGEDADSQYGMDEHEQQNEVTGVLSGKRPRTSYAKSRNAFVQKDFIWDQYVKYFATSLLALTVIDFALEYFSGGDAVCFPDA